MKYGLQMQSWFEAVSFSDLVHPGVLAMMCFIYVRSVSMKHWEDPIKDDSDTWNHQEPGLIGSTGFWVFFGFFCIFPKKAKTGEISLY